MESQPLNTRLIFLLLFFLSFLSTTRADQVDDYIKQTMLKRRIPGLAVAVVKDGKVIKAQGYGVANLETETPVTAETVFELASVTKQFTATAIMMLVEEGKISIDDKISKYLDNTPDSWKEFTVRHLLTHTSGLPGLDNDFNGLVWTLNVSTAAMYDAARRDKLSFAPGDKWQYSDVGYFLLGMIIEKVSGHKYADFLAERIFKPLGMTNTLVENQLKVIKNRARGYTIFQNEVVNIRRDQQVELASHYGIMSTVLDMAKWDAALRTDKILKQSSLELMWTAVRLNNGKTHQYGFGWELDEQRGHKIVEHGGITGTQITRFVNDSLTVIVLTNLGSWGKSTPEVNSWGITRKVAEFYISNLAYRPIEDHDQQFTATIQNLFLKPSIAAWDETLFATEIWPRLKASLSSQQEQLASLGQLRSVELLERSEVGEQRRYLYRLRYDSLTMLLFVARNKAGKISSISAEPENEDEQESKLTMQ